MASSAETVVDDSWRVQLFIAARDGNLEFIESVASSYPNAIHENFCECLDDGVLEWESLKWYEFGEATCLYIATSYCQLDVARWLLENGVDREKACYHGQTPLDVVGQCRFDAEAALDIRQALTEELKRPRAPVAPSCIAKIGYDDIVKKVYETVQVGKGATKRVPQRVTETVATCKVSVSWPTFWLSDITSSRDGTLGGGVTYELQYRSRVGQDWILAPTKTPNKTLTSLLPGQVYDFKVRAKNSAGWGDFSPTVELEMPSERKREGDESSETTN